MIFAFQGVKARRRGSLQIQLDSASIAQVLIPNKILYMMMIIMRMIVIIIRITMMMILMDVFAACHKR